MLRIRRYRYFVVFAALVLFLLYRVTKDSEQWEGLSTPLPFTPINKSPPEVGHAGAPSRADTAVSQDDVAGSRSAPLYQDARGEEQAPIKIPNLKSAPDIKPGKYDLPTTTKPPIKATQEVTQNTEASKTTEAPVIDIPDRKTPHDEWNNNGKHNHNPPAGREGRMSTSTTTTIHWSKQPEHFPVFSDSIIPLPTGKPKSVPKIQHAFHEETAEARQKRIHRLNKVKAEMERAWTGYKTYAWMHDELSPVTKKSRDPFCGWAATLVDSLDTLWIMGMKDEFEEAVKAVANIDFTYSPQRAEIPVFETTIRYLGGLLGAYDVSGGKAGGYNILLDKAVELAEILMGVFDTPNRMPVLYYHWKPAHASQPKRAETGISIAELGSLAMEFTRLAQVTQEDKYYDAVARITDAFEDWQNRGTSIPGIFPERVDATGCNRTAAADAAAELAKAVIDQPQGALDTPEGYTGREYSSRPSKSKTSPAHASDSEFVVVPGEKEGRPSKGEFHALDRRSGPVEMAQDAPSAEKPNDSSFAEKKLQSKKPKGPAPPEIYQKMMRNQQTSEPFNIEEFGTDYCFPQGLAPAAWGSESYSMGGSQDSTYEYFPKQFLLLGGLEPKYKSMHLKVADAVKKWLLYRPMVPGDRDILFSAKLSTRGHPEKDVTTQFEVTHLTCFIGGMFGMAGKIFEDTVDVEIGKKLTDGCVWAYESMPTGIMPEGASVVPCSNVHDCHWNETVWQQYLDPLWDTRDLQIQDFELRQAELKKLKAEMKQDELRREVKAKTFVEEDEEEEARRSWKATVVADESVDSAAGYQAKKQKGESAGTPNLRKRKMNPITDDDGVETSSNDNLPPNKKISYQEDEDVSTRAGSDKIGQHLQGELKLGAAQIPLTDADDTAVVPEPARPLSHEEYVENRLKTEKLPPGFVSINHRRYILRPEAIESVWYMYRITGDTKWQEKGWRMFEAIISATQTEAGHSAINDVLTPNSDQVNEMESFWLAETLKYFYLLYSAPDVISLDEWVLNTEAHPFKRPT
ncbi:glycosyl hydrolase family 47-domain-containing protein [Pseudomassariella vexata]|uniref:alpha-1,2-Mannosidase n=1 Tax=Pseudomassariella vexata TaxID=1141098 RepID=A0A1Y2DNZ6_9PEZI|nr:glycosyl hydrolase family 47-domain-containing protein [Pseudomassariella vexata]ORY61002.1 glycosyl hydrolase family 47-domain-containing protein [Pseudomassariella vexata]